MEQKFASKIGLAVVIPVIVVLASVIVAMLEDKIFWAGILILFSFTAFFIHLFLTTYYSIKKDILQIKSGIFYNLNIDIKTIRKITETNNIISSPAISLDRLEISYNKYDTVLISPKDKTTFLKMILEINPTIEIKYKK